MEKVVRVEWTQKAEDSLKPIFNFYAEHSEELAYKAIDQIINTANSIVFAKQYQVDDLNPKYRRMILKDYKILYKESNNVVSIITVLATKTNPSNLTEL